MRNSVRYDPSEETGQDSFLDIVANIVGILIILVMVVGVRASYSPDKKEVNPDLSSSSLTANRAFAQVQSLTSELVDLHRQAKYVRQEIAVRKDERQLLQTVVLAAEGEIDRRQGKLNKEARTSHETNLQLADKRGQLDRLMRELMSTEAMETRPVTINNIPTPISKTVHGEEVHFQLRGGRLSYIPLEDLLTEFKRTVKQKIWKIEGRRRFSDTVGPLGGFRLRYTLQRFDIPFQTQMQTGMGGSLLRLVRWELIPVSEKLGETWEEAQQEDSEFHHDLNRCVRRGKTMTVWTYPDSFGELRRLREELHVAGFTLAARPLPDGVSIGGSPLGSRSAAQ